MTGTVFDGHTIRELKDLPEIPADRQRFLQILCTDKDRTVSFGTFVRAAIRSLTESMIHPWYHAAESEASSRVASKALCTRSRMAERGLRRTALSISRHADNAVEVRVSD